MGCRVQSIIGGGGKLEITNGIEQNYFAAKGVTIPKNTFIEKEYQYADNIIISEYNMTSSSGGILWEGEDEYLVQNWNGGSYDIRLLRKVGEDFVMYPTSCSLNYNNQSLKVLTKLSDNSWLISERSKTPSLRIITFDGTQMVGGTAVSIASYTGEVLINSSTVLLYETYLPSSSSREKGYIKIAVATISGSTITIGDPVTLVSAMGDGWSSSVSSMNFGEVKVLSTGKIVITYGYSINDYSDTYYNYMAVLSISGTTISVGTNLSISDYTFKYFLDLGNDYFIFIYKYSSSSSSYYIVCGQVSGTTITLGSQVDINYGETIDSYKISNTEAVIFMYYSSTMYVYLVSRNGTTLSLKNNSTSCATTEGIGLIRVSDLTWVMIYRYQSSSFYNALITISGNVTISTPTSIFSNTYRLVYSDDEILAYYYSSVNTLLIMYYDNGLVTKSITGITFGSKTTQICYYDKSENLFWIFSSNGQAVCVDFETEVVLFNGTYTVVGGASPFSIYKKSNALALMYFETTYISSSSNNIKYAENDIVFVNGEIARPGEAVKIAETKIDGISISNITDSTKGKILALQEV